VRSSPTARRRRPGTAVPVRPFAWSRLSDWKEVPEWQSGGRRASVLYGCVAVPYRGTTCLRMMARSPQDDTLSPDDLVFTPISEMASHIARGDVAATALLDACVARIERYEPALNAF